MVLLHTFCLILLCLGFFLSYQSFAYLFCFSFLWGFWWFFKSVLLFYFVFVCFKGREKRNIRLGRKVGRIWEELGKGKIMIKICCMKNCSHKKLNKFQKYLVQTCKSLNSFMLCWDKIFLIYWITRVYIKINLDYFFTLKNCSETSVNGLCGSHYIFAWQCSSRTLLLTWS